MSQCSTAGTQRLTGYKKVAATNADSGTAQRIQYSKEWVAFTKGTNRATSKYRKVRFQALRACINWRLKFC